MARFDILTSNIDKFQDSAFSTEFNMDSYLLSDDDAVKKLIATKNPKLTKDQINIIVDDEETLIKRVEESSEGFPNEDDTELEDAVSENNLSSEQKEIRRIDREARKKARKEKIERLKRENEEKKKEKIEEIKESKRIYKDKLKEFYEEIKRIKTSIKNAVFNLFKSAKELAKDLLLAIIKTSSSIPGITLMITAPPWNIAHAITATAIIVQLYLRLIKEIKNVAPSLGPIKYLPAITDKKNLSILSTIINIPMKIVLGLWAPIGALDKVVKTLLGAVKKSMQKNREKIFRKATKRLRKLGHLRRFGLPLKVGDQTLRGVIGDPYSTDSGVVFSYDEDDVEEVVDLLTTFKINGPPNRTSTRVVDYQLAFDGSLDSIEGELDGLEFEIPKTEDIEEDDFANYIYDAKLPDGTIIKNISDDGIDYLKEKYTVQYSNFIPDDIS
jgi:hypothetical protein